MAGSEQFNLGWRLGNARLHSGRPRALEQPIPLIHEHGPVALLRSLHDELDSAVLACLRLR